jgi:four helix bundle protein
MLHIAANSKYIDQETFEKYYNKTKIISAMIYKYIKTIQ